LEEIKEIKFSNNYFFITATKWFSNKKTIQETINEYFPRHKWLVSILWPSFAKEVIDKNITCICSVSKNENEAIFVQNLLSNDYFRLYTTTDVIWAEICSSIKNALAIASWIITWLWYGENTKASLITRWLKEMALIWNTLWAKQETFFGLTWLWDLILTCSSDESRNFQAWYQIWKADSAKEFLKNNQITVEWIATIWVIEEIAQKHKLELPILHSLYLVVYKDAKPSEMLKKIMQRPFTKES
jgi:glycerol-3-phosphate dehydrogenase (NAD(P)+)